MMKEWCKLVIPTWFAGVKRWGKISLLADRHKLAVSMTRALSDMCISIAQTPQEARAIIKLFSVPELGQEASFLMESTALVSS
jgi:hypothetical protein